MQKADSHLTSYFAMIMLYVYTYVHMHRFLCLNCNVHIEVDEYQTGPSRFLIQHRISPGVRGCIFRIALQCQSIDLKFLHTLQYVLVSSRFSPLKCICIGMEVNVAVTCLRTRHCRHSFPSCIESVCICTQQMNGHMLTHTFALSHTHVQ